MLQRICVCSCTPGTFMCSALRVGQRYPYQMWLQQSDWYEVFWTQAPGVPHATKPGKWTQLLQWTWTCFALRDTGMFRWKSVCSWLCSNEQQLHFFTRRFIRPRPRCQLLERAGIQPCDGGNEGSSHDTTRSCTRSQRFYLTRVRQRGLHVADVAVAAQGAGHHREARHTCEAPQSILGSCSHSIPAGQEIASSRQTHAQVFTYWDPMIADEPQEVVCLRVGHLLPASLCTARPQHLDTD